jgi:hypothetical protein
VGQSGAVNAIHCFIAMVNPKSLLNLPTRGLIGKQLIALYRIKPLRRLHLLPLPVSAGDALVDGFPITFLGDREPQ